MFKRQASIATVLIAALLAVVTLLLSAFAAAYDEAEKNDRRDKLQAELTFSVQQQVAALTLPMWDLDETHLLDIVRSGMQNRDVFAIVAATQDKHYVLTRDANWRPVQTADLPTAPGYLTAQGLIDHEGETLGTVQVFITPQFMEAELRDRRHQMMIFIVLLDLTLVLSLGLLLWHLMLKPVRAMERFAATVRQGDPTPDQPDKAWFFGELDSLNQSIRGMTTMLDSRYKALQDSENRLTLAARAASLGIWEWDIVNDKLIWDEEVRKQYGLPSGHYSGSLATWRETLLSEALEEATQILEATIRGEKDWSMEFPIKRSDGEVRVIKGMASSIRNAQGQVVRLVGLNFDITERQHSEDQIKQLNAELEQRVKDRTAQLESAVSELALARDQAQEATRSKSEFLANMSHEIRTPMNAIVGLTGLAMRTELTPKQRNYLTNVKSAASALLMIVDDILDFSKMEAGKLLMESRPFTLDDVLDKLISIVALKAQEKGLDFLIDIEPDLLGRPVLGDALRLGQVLINLCNNAIKFTPRGAVVLRIRQGLPSPNAHLQLLFEVQDSGIGMSQEQTDKLFAPFSQVDASTTRIYGGTGLGLAICKQLVELMQGELRVNSELGQGSTFSFSAYFGQSQPLSIGPSPSAKAAPQHILVIHPSEQTRAILGRQLSGLGHTPTLVGQAQEALFCLTQRHDLPPFEVVLLDAHLQDADSFELAQQIRAHTHPSTVRILICTTLADEATALRAPQEGLAGVLYYPILQPALQDVLQSTDEASQNTAPPKLPARASEAETPFTQLHGRRVLLVEDNAINQIVATDLLSEVAGMHVTVAEDGEQALVCMQRANFDIVLMDIQMPVMDGLQATQLIRLNPAYSSLPIVAMTAHAMVRDQQRCLAAGMNDYVTKPFEPSELFAVLSKWIAPRSAMAPAAHALTQTPEASQADTPVQAADIDFDKGLRRCARRPELYRKLATRFLSSRREDAEAIRAALQQGNTEAAAMIAHQQISTAGILGADSLSAAARALQMTIMEGPAVDWPVLLESFDQQLIAVLDALERHFADPT